MPAMGPAMPQARFCTASAKEKVSRVQPRSVMMGCSQKPKPWRMPIDSVTMRAPHSSTCWTERPEAAGRGVFICAL